MVATPLVPVSVTGITELPAPVASDTTNGNSFPVGADLYIENGTGAQTVKFTPQSVGNFAFAEVTLNVAANKKYRVEGGFFKSAFPTGTVTVTGSAATVLMRAENS